MKKRGFTLIELIAVLAIMSIILSIGIIRFNVIDKFKSNIEMQTLINDMNHAKIKAVSTGNSYEVRFNEDSYQVIKYDKDETRPLEIIFSRDLEYMKFTNFKTSNGGNIIRFNSSGTVTNPGTITILVYDGSSEYVEDIIARVGGGYVRYSK